MFKLTTELLHRIDFATIFALSIPTFLIYVAFTFVYFLKVDKIHVSQACYYKSHGLSRFCLAGIFFLFGLILFDLNLEFILAYLTQYFVEDVVLKESVLFRGMTSVYKTMPINVLINFTIICTAIYTSTEGIIASLKTLKVEPGISVELPLLKRQRLSAMFILWCYIAVIATLYNVLIGSEMVTFPVKNIYISTGLTLIILFLAERSPSLLKDTTITTKIVKNAENVVPPDNKTVVEADAAWNGVDDKMFGEKVSLDDVMKIAGSVDDIGDK